MNWMNSKPKIIQRHKSKTGLYASTYMPGDKIDDYWVIDYLPIEKALEIVLGKNKLFLPIGISRIKSIWEIKFNKKVIVC